MARADRLQGTLHRDGTASVHAATRAAADEAKPLTGLYLPTAGYVSWDDTDLADLDPLSLWRSTAMAGAGVAAGGEDVVLGATVVEGVTRPIGG
ncbi:hypothetical protein [Streptomyces sp. x-80]|uniref:hypothetical protein n=1 Tax=Streptomyces sp. x-80 TaxID=2789282 RepID=UPI003980AA1F